MGTDEEDDEDQLFTKKDSKMMVSEISTAINEALKPLTQREKMTYPTHDPVLEVENI